MWRRLAAIVAIGVMVLPSAACAVASGFRPQFEVTVKCTNKGKGPQKRAHYTFTVKNRNPNKRKVELIIFENGAKERANLDGKSTGAAKEVQEDKSVSVTYDMKKASGLTAKVYDAAPQGSAQYVYKQELAKPCAK